ncbi:triphosphoribosyl-dephospho-CoA synthase (plasmid) [Streptomyces sp. BI20]|uniref:triphosphoribosyl-dephospho-CoA synthase n=1 Tax=Streptomyces sp. BI20 TaxID=3403460 RepID=UPI003C74E8DB
MTLLSPLRPPAPAAGASADRIADLASAALIAEAELTPKPGLVDAAGSGAHHDMDLALLLKSARVLRDPFAEMARAAARAGRPSPELRAELARVGRRAETRMLTATGGVNTHRGAIWALGLLTGAAALTPRAGHSPRSFTDALCATAGRIAAHPDPAAPVTGPSHGRLAALRHGAGGARAEAAAGFPHVRLALAALRRSRAAGGDEDSARLDALLAVIASLPDTCLLHRGGPEGLAAAQGGARAVLDAGGSAGAPGRAALLRLDADLTARGLSPGGSADLLAAALHADALSRPAGTTADSTTADSTPFDRS